jgi:hypothetical protein
MILDIYKDSLEYSAKDWKTLVKLGVIALFSILLFPIFLIAGYNYRVVNTAVHGVINGRDPLPDFDNIIGMFVDGCKVLIVETLYLLVPLIVFIIFIAIASALTGVLASAIIVIGSLITFVLAIVACLMSQMGICHMAHNEGVFSKAFRINEIKEAIDDIGWFKCLMTFLGLLIITTVISTVVSGIIFGIFTAFGVSGSMLGADASGVFILGAVINLLVTMFIVGPYLSIFNARSIGLLYTMQI